MTTVILLATLTFFFLPHTIYFFVSLNTDTSSHEALSPVASFLVVLYMTLLPYLKMISDPLVYGVRMCRRPSDAAGAAVTSRAIYVDPASTAVVLRGGPTTSPVTSVVTTSTCCCRCWSSCVARLSCVHCQRRSDNNQPDTCTAVVSSIPRLFSVARQLRVLLGN